MVGRSLVCAIGLLTVSAVGCKEAETSPERIQVAAAHRSCEEGDACGVVETSCTSQGCECGVAVNEAHLLDYQQRLAECRGQKELRVCESECETPFGKCFEGACVLTSEPPELFRRGRSVQAVCEGSRGTYVGCPQCPPNEPCKSCMPCECPSSHRWSRKGCRAVVQTEPREIRVEARPPRLSFGERIKTRVTNESKRKIWLKTVCGTPFYRARKKEDGWEAQYEPFRETECRTGSVAIAPGASRHFVIGNLNEFEDGAGTSVGPGSYRFELTYTDGDDSFRYHATVYSAELDLVPTLSRR